MPVRALFLIPALLIPLLADTKPSEPPALVSKVLPPPPQGDFITDTVQVEMLVDESGTPAALSCPDGLPDSAVKALFRWRFTPGKINGRRSIYKVAVVVPVPRTLQPALERSFGRTMSSEVKLRELYDAAQSNDSDKTEKYLQNLDESQKPGADHTIALAHALLTGSPEQIHQARIDHLLWMIQNTPELDILSSPLALIPADGEPLGDSALRQQAKEAWLKQIAAPAPSPAIIDHALNFLQFVEPVKAATFLISKTRPKAALLLGHEYALHGVGVSTLHPLTGMPVLNAASLPDSPLESNFRDSLLKSESPKLVLSALATVIGIKQTLHSLPSGYDDFCSALYNHAKQLVPHTSLSCDSKDLIFDPSPLATPTTASTVTEARLDKRVQPRYPEAAKRQRMMGRIRFSAIITEQGDLDSIELLNGAALFYEETLLAVKQWHYKPTMLDGKPVAIKTEIVVTYTLSQ